MKSTALALALVLAAFVPAHAGTETVDKSTAALEPTPFDKGRLELQILAGAYFSLGGDSESRPDLHYATAAARLGVMLNDPAGSGCLRGNWELLLQLFGGAVFEGPGDGLGGASILLRYNFVQPDAKFVPYFQIGAGAVYSDIHEDETQRLIGQEWEIGLEAALGARCFLSPQWSLAFEAGYRHISNADNSARNIGLNSIGGLIGFGYHF